MILRNERLLIDIDLPDEGYQETRFDWTGKIKRLEWNEIPLTTTETEAGESTLGKGLYNEFCMDSLLGFEEAEVGDWCHKIGVGLLKKVESEYHFHQSYEVKPAPFSHERSEQKLTIRCVGEIHQGFGYELVKTIELMDTSLFIHYTLTNTGEKPINTTEYTHNFLAFDHRKIGPDYSLFLPSPIQQNLFGEFVNPDNALGIKTQRISLLGNPSEPFFISHACGHEPTTASWKLTCDQIPISLSEEVSLPASKVNLWGTSHVISPELFVEIHVDPGEKKFWTRGYQIHEEYGES